MGQDLTMDDQTILSLFESLTREVRGISDAVKRMERELGTVKDSLQRIEARLDRQGGIIQGGTRQVARLITWSEEIDQLLAARDRRIEELERRLNNLESKSP